MAFLLQFLPILCAAVNAGIFLLQVRSPNTYPWIVILAPILTAAVLGILLWKKHRDASEWRATLPLLSVLSACAYGLLLSEGMLSQWIIPLFAGCITWYMLYLVFVSIFIPARYPVNGISHANLALVPVTVWLVAYTSYGLTVFINTSRLLPLLVMMATCCILFYSTSQASGARASRWRWTLIGAWVGIQLGIFVDILPLSMETVGTVAALCCGYALRVRRYGISPPVPKRIILTEAVSAAVLLILVLAFAAWR